MQRILVVDDEPHMLKLMERIITEKTTFHIDCTSTPLEVPEMLDRTTYDLIVTDLKMPGMDGMDILNYVNDRNRWEKVIIMTAFGSMEKALEALASGVYDYITKPFKKEQIIFTINRAMRWQSIKREMLQMSQVFDCTPYDQAVVEFKKEYARRMLERYNNDPDVVAEKTGLSVADITRLAATDPDESES